MIDAPWKILERSNAYKLTSLWSSRKGSMTLYEMQDDYWCSIMGEVKRYTDVYRYVAKPCCTSISKIFASCFLDSFCQRCVIHLPLHGTELLVIYQHLMSDSTAAPKRLMRLTSTCSLPKVFKPTCRLQAFCHVSILMLSKLVSRASGSRLSRMKIPS